MPLIESLIIGVGSAVAKGILQLWLKDEPLLAAAAEQTAAILERHATDLRQRRAAQRQLDQIAERAAEGVLALLDKEARDLPEARREAIANAAGATLTHTPISAALLAEHNLDPSALAAHYRERPGSAGGNPLRFANPAERALYDRILFHAAQMMVDIASQLPRFTQDVFAELLLRQDLLTAKANRIIEGMERVLAAQGGGDLDAERFETDFRLACIRRFDQMELFGVDLAESNKRYKLSVAYVSLEVERGIAGGDDGPLSEVLSVEAALADAQRLFVRGPAGSGKTTLLQWLAVFAAGRELTGALAALNDAVPFLIKLRELSGQPLPEPKDLARQAVGPGLGEAPPDWAGRLLDGGRALVLIDGVDEATEDERPKVRDWLRNLVARYPRARFVVTSRPHAAAEGWLDADRFVEASLRELGRAEVRRFIAHWHEAVAGGLRDETERAALPGLAAALTNQVEESRALRRFAATPLLCAILCALHRDRSQQLPADRLELYRACIAMFFRRDRERKVRMADYPELTDGQSHWLLQDLAWWLIRNGKSQATPAEIDGRLGHALGQLAKPPAGIDGTQTRRLFVERVGILRQLSAGAIDFPHRTFQEYLAAYAAVDENDHGLLVANAHDDQWREVVIMAAGLMPRREAVEGLLLELIRAADAQPGLRHVLYLVAAAAYETVEALPRGSCVPQDIGERLRRIVPPKGMTDAKELTKAGDLVVPLLRRSPNWSARQSAASIRTLAGVGSDLAAQALGTWFGDRRRSVERELLDQLLAAGQGFLARALEGEADRLLAATWRQLQAEGRSAVKANPARAVLCAIWIELRWRAGSALGEIPQRFAELVLGAIEDQVPLRDRFRLALILGRIGDPRLGDVRGRDWQAQGLVEVPAGRYAYQDEEQVIERSFWIGRYPVTNSQFAPFIDEGGYRERRWWSDDGWGWREANGIVRPEYWEDDRFNAPNQPVVGVSFYGAQAFCRWAGGRLPTEQEWEAAARGPQGYEYPWGGPWEDGICNSVEAGLGVTSPVGIFPRSRQKRLGIEDLAGNVWEWCDSLWADGEGRVLLGGSWDSHARRLRSAYRLPGDPGYRDGLTGFRLAPGPELREAQASR